MSKLLAVLGLAFALGASPVLAQSDADVNAAVESVLGDPAPYHAAFDAIHKAVVDGDKAAFAGWVSYPIALMVGDKDMTIKDAAEFEKHYDAILTDEIKTAITEQKWQDLFANTDGIMYGNGQVWLNGVCKDDKCAEFDVRIMTIQSTADITPKAN